jgi:hypothetical protein
VLLVSSSRNMAGTRMVPARKGKELVFPTPNRTICHGDLESNEDCFSTRVWFPVQSLFLFSRSVGVTHQLNSDGRLQRINFYETGTILAMLQSSVAFIHFLEITAYEYHLIQRSKERCMDLN